MSNTLTKSRQKQGSRSMQWKATRSARWRQVRQCNAEIEQARALFVQGITVSVVAPTDRKESYSAIVDSRRGIVIK